MEDTLTLILIGLTLLFPFLCVAPFMIGIVVLIIRQARRLQQQITEGWGQVAERTGMTLNPSKPLTPPALTGSYRHRPARLSMYTASQGKTQVRYTTLEIGVQNPSGWAISLQRETGLDALGRMFGVQDVTVGDPAFDQAMQIGSRPPEAAVQALAGNAALRETVLGLPMVELDLDSRRVYYSQHGVETNPETLIAALDAASDFADAVEEAAGVEVEAAQEVKAPVFASDARSEPAAAPSPFTRYGTPPGLSSPDPMRTVRLAALGVFVLIGVMLSAGVCLLSAYLGAQ